MSNLSPPIPDGAEDIEVSSHDSDNNIIKHMIDSYGGITSIVSMAYQGLDKIPVLKNNKYLAGATKAFSIGMVVYDFYNKIKSYYDDKSESVEDLRDEYINSILELDEDDYVYRYNNREIHMTTEQIQWVLESHGDELDDVVIHGYYNLENGTKIPSIPTGNFCTLFEYDNFKYLLEFSCSGQDALIGGPLYSFKRGYVEEEGHMNQFIDTLNALYMDSMGFDKNIILYDGYSIMTRPRSELIDFEVNTVDFGKLQKRIVRVLDEGGRRGFLFVGNPGTGKTTILLKLENTLTNYPIMYAKAENLNDERSIDRLSSFIKKMGKCIVFIEDMDALEIDQKTSKIAPLLSLLDNSRTNASVVFISTINDAGLVTESIVRTGRFDEVIEIHEPTENQQIFDILSTHWHKLHPNAEWGYPTKCEDISWFTYLRLKRRRFTQSDYRELVQLIHMDDKELNNDTLINAMKTLVKSKKALSKY